MNCLECGKKFKKNRFWQKFCSNKCLTNHSNKRKLTTKCKCKLCGKTFKGQPSSKFCSKNCLHESLKKYKICPNCLNEFNYNNIKQICCSRKCSNELKKVEKIVSCMQCGKEINRYPSQIKKYIFCNSKCMGEYYSENNFGEKHPLWKGGKIDGRGYKWRIIRKEVLKRDGYKCSVCGIKPRNTKNLDIHHIIKYRDFDNSIDANKLTNLITVCKSCHTKVFTNNGL